MHIYLFKGTVTYGEAPAAASNANELLFKNYVVFNNCISRTNNTQIDDAHDSDVVIPNIWNFIAILQR